MRATLLAAAGYTVLTVLMTWPLATGLTRELPWDLGDPLLNCWIIGRNAARLFAAFTQGTGALRGFWDAGIFHPEPLTLAYSDHLIAQAVPTLPVYALTENPVLGYNLVFLSTFVLSALFCFLFVRDLTGSAGAAFVGGLLYGFSPYRVDQLPHVQVLSSQWMPLVLFGLRRYLAGGRRGALVLGAAALVMHNLSCGYLLLFFAPFVPLYALHEMAARGLVRRLAVWRDLLLAGLAVAAATVPFLQPYRELRTRGGIVRSLVEVEKYSADVYSYLTATEALRLLGPVLRPVDKPEGAVYPGMVTLALAAAAVVVHARRAWRDAPALPSRRPALVFALATLGALHLVGAALVLLGLGPGLSAWIPALRVHSFGRAALLGAILLAVAAAASPRARAWAGRLWRSPVFFFAVAAALAFWLSLGPTVRSLDRVIEAPALYGLLYQHVPGFDSLRVPARYAMLVAFFLSALAGMGAAAVQRLRHGTPALAGLSALFLLESMAAPIRLSRVWRDPELRKPPAGLTRAEAPGVYHAARLLPETAVLIEFPFGSPPYEVRYMFYSLHHGRRLVNGFSGWEPPSYLARSAVLDEPWSYPERAWTAVAGSGATHAIVHEGAWRRRQGTRISAWLEGNGARPLLREAGDALLELPSTPSPDAARKEQP